MFCKDTAAGKQWMCPDGTKKVNECVWPAPDDSGNTDTGKTTNERPARPSGYGYGG